MHQLDYALLATGLLLCITIVIMVWRVLLYWKKKKLQEKKDELIQQKVNITSEFQLPISYQRIQGTRPWRHHQLPMIGVTEYTDNESHASSKNSIVQQHQKSISAHMLSDLYKHGNHVSSIRGESSCTSDAEIEERLTAASDEGSVSSFGSEDGGKNRYIDANVHSIKKRISITRGSRHTPNKPSFKKTGKISFETEYNERKKELHINILNASELAPKLNTEHVHPFVRAYLVPGKLQKQATHFKKETKQPVFNEMLIFADIAKEKMGRYKLRLKVYNHSKLRKHELIGEVDMALISLDLRLKETFDVDLFIKKSESSKSSCKITLYHEAAESRLQVIVEEAKNLPKRKTTGINPDTYVLLRLYKVDVMETQESETHWNTISPHFGETFSFHLTTDFEFPLNAFSLVISIVNHNMIGRDEIIGHVIFSSDSPQFSAVSHWNEANSCPQQKHTRSHFLVAPNDI